jgi:TolB-like protein
LADIFISYARSTAAQANAAAAALRAAGYSVWLDEDLPAHKPYTPEIEAQLDEAKAALVIWSAEAARSEWVLSEANRAREERKLVQVSVDRARLPMPFDQIQCADVSGWSGDATHAGWIKALASVAELAGRMATPDPTTAPESKVAAEPLLAVLAFDNLSGDPELAYFSDGVSEEILDTVGRGSGIRVIARSSSFQFRGADKAVRKVAADLRATHLLDGSVRRSGSHVRIAARLVECASETAVWSDRFDRELTDVFALQDEIAAAVAEALKTTFARRAPAAPIDPATYELYLRARELIRSESATKGMGNVREMLREVTEKAPNFADGWAMFASSVMATARVSGPGAIYSRRRAEAVAAIDTSLRLEPTNALAHITRLSLAPEGAYETAHDLVQEALKIAPNVAFAQASAAYHAFSTGRLREASERARRGIALDPLDGWSAGLYADSLTGLEDPEAPSLYLSGRSKWPNNPNWSNALMLDAVYRNDWSAFAEAEAYADAHGLFTEAYLRGTRAFGRAVRDGDPAFADRLRRAMNDELVRGGSVSLNLVIALAVVTGKVDEAFDFVDRASFDQIFTEEGGEMSQGYNPGLIFITQSRRRLAPDPRFIGLCRKLGLTDFWLKTDLWPDIAAETPYNFRTEARRLGPR